MPRPLGSMRRGDANAARGLDNACGDFQQTQTDGGKLGVPQRMPFRYGVAHIEQQRVVPENSIRPDSHGEGESAHDRI